MAQRGGGPPESSPSCSTGSRYRFGDGTLQLQLLSDDSSIEIGSKL